MNKSFNGKGRKKRKFVKKAKKPFISRALVKKLVNIPYPDAKVHTFSNTTGTASLTSLALLINGIAEGFSENERVGTDIRMTYCNINLLCQDNRALGSVPCIIHWALVLAPVAVLDSDYNSIYNNNDVQALRNVPNIRKYTILKSGYVLHTPSTDTSLKMIKIQYKFPAGGQKVRYNTAIAPVNSTDFDYGCLVLHTRASQTSVNVHQYVEARVGYTDC